MKQKIDYSKPVTRDDIDWETYNYKFKLCDEYLNGKDLPSDTVSDLLRDVTCFSYMFFNIDGEQVKLYPYQDMILNDQHRFKIFRAARQIGKSISLDIKSAMNLLIDHGKSHSECIISASLSQATYQMRRVKGLLNSMRIGGNKVEWKENTSTDNSTVLSIEVKDDEGNVKYTNMLVITPCTESSLGYSFDEVNLDEIEYWKDVDVEHFMNSIIAPTILATNGRITTFSNPNGSETYIAQLEKLKLKDGTPKYHTYVFNFFDRPGNDQDKFDIATIGHTRQQIESQYLAIRTLSDRYYFTADEIDRSISQDLEREKDWHATGKETFWFLDVGAKHDLSVLVGATVTPDKVDPINFMHINIFKFHVYPKGYPLSRVCGSHNIEHETDGWHYEKSVREYLEEHQLVRGVNPTFGCDVTGNSGIIPLFNSININPIDITFSGPKKWAMYQRMKYFLEKKLLHVVKCKEYEYQMKRIVVKKLKSNTYNRVGHETESDHDDVPDSVAGVILLADDRYYVEPNFEVI